MFDQVRAFHRPNNIHEALDLLQKHKHKAALVAGNTDLLLQDNHSVQVLVDITRLGLAYIRRKGEDLHIGATTTMSALETSTAVQCCANGILSKAASSCGSPQMRNRATVGGNLVTASPAADTATPLLAMNAEVVLQSLHHKHRVPLVDFFRGPHLTILNGSLLTEIIIPHYRPQTAWRFEKFGRTELDIAIVNVAVGVRADNEHHCRWISIALGAVAPTPMRAIQAEKLMIGQLLTQPLIERASQAAAEEARPIDDLRASAAYRREICRVLVRRALQACVSDLGGVL